MEKDEETNVALNNKKLSLFLITNTIFFLCVEEVPTHRLCLCVGIRNIFSGEYGGNVSSRFYEYIGKSPHIASCKRCGDFLHDTQVIWWEIAHTDEMKSVMDSHIYAGICVG